MGYRQRLTIVLWVDGKVSDEFNCDFRFPKANLLIFRAITRRIDQQISLISSLRNLVNSKPSRQPSFKQSPAMEVLSPSYLIMCT
jgi:hypothetical protein